MTTPQLQNFIRIPRHSEWWTVFAGMSPQETAVMAWRKLRTMKRKTGDYKEARHSPPTVNTHTLCNHFITEPLLYRDQRWWYYNHYQVTTTLLVAGQPLTLIPQYLPSVTTHIHMHTHYTSEGLGRIFLKWETRDMSVSGAIITRLHCGCGSGGCSILMYKEENTSI